MPHIILDKTDEGATDIQNIIHNTEVDTGYIF